MEPTGEPESSSSSKESSCPTQEKVEERPSSPIADCAICLEHLTDKSFTNSCLHMFCFRCLLAWSKIKPECPLCKQDFRSIIHNIRSMQDYDEYHVPPPEARLQVYVNPAITPNPIFARDPHDFITNNRNVFSYRTTIMSGAFRVPRGRPDSLLIQPYVDNLEIRAELERYNANPTVYTRYHRREVYLKDLETLAPPAGGRYRECSPDFYRANVAQIHRLARWLQRELSALSQITTRFATQDLLRTIMDMLPVYTLNSTTFFNTLHRHLGQHTTRFIREFHHFATSPYEMEQYDRGCIFVRHRTGTQISFIVTVGTDDSEDVQVIPNGSNHSFRPWIDVSDLPTDLSDLPASYVAAIQGRSSIAQTVERSPSPAGSDSTVINISDSETDDCVIVDEIRSPHETIILDDSESEESDIKSVAESQPDALRSSSAYYQPDSTSAVSTTTVKSEYDGENKRKNRSQIVSTCQIDVPSCDSSIMSTEPWSNESSDDKSSKKRKRKRSKRYYRVRDMMRKRTPRDYSICEPSEDLIMLTESSDIETDQDDFSGEKNSKRKRKMRSNDSECAPKKRKCQTTPVTSLPRLRSCLKKTENNNFTTRNNRTRKTSSNSNVCLCNDLSQFRNEPSTSRGIRNCHRETCQFYSTPPYIRNTYSSDSD